MEHINFFDNQLGNEFASQLLEVLRSNQIFKYVNLKYNRVSVRLIDEITKRISENKKSFKKKLVPHLKREIENIQVTDKDFEECKGKIEEVVTNKEVVKI